jgi:hypothetical protein
MIFREKRRTPRQENDEVEPNEPSRSTTKRLTPEREEALNEIFDRIAPRSREETEQYLEGHRTEEQGQ